MARVAPRIADVDPVGQHADRRPADRQRTAVRRGVDPVRAAGDHGDTRLGQVGGQIGRDPRPVRERRPWSRRSRPSVAAPGPGGRPSQPQTERHAAPALHRVAKAQVSSGSGHSSSPGTTNRAPQACAAARTRGRSSVGGASGRGSPELRGQHPVPGGATALPRWPPRDRRFAAVHGQAERQPRTAFRPAGHERTPLIRTPLASPCSTSRPRRMATAAARSSAPGRGRPARSANDQAEPQHLVDSAWAQPALDSSRRRSSGARRAAAGACAGRGPAPRRWSASDVSRRRKACRARASATRAATSADGFGLRQALFQERLAQRAKRLGDVDPVPDRAGDLLGVAPDGHRRAGALHPRRRRQAARARVRGQHQLEPGGVAGLGFAAAEQITPGLQRRSQSLEDGFGENSGASSRNSTPRCAQEIAPGRASRGPPPTTLAIEAEWCGSAYGGRREQAIGQIEAGQGVHGRHLEGLDDLQIGQQARQPLGEHRLADARRTGRTRCGADRPPRPRAPTLASNCPATSARSSPARGAGERAPRPGAAGHPSAPDRRTPPPRRTHLNTAIS